MIEEPRIVGILPDADPRKDPFTTSLMAILEAALSANELEAARRAIYAEHVRWIGEMDWGKAVSSLLIAALQAIEEERHRAA